MSASAAVLLKRADQVVGPLEEHLALLGTHPEHVADDRHRQRRGEIPDEVALAALAHRVDQRVAQRVDRRLKVFHAFAGEAGVDELAPQQMLRVVHLDHHLHARLVGPDAARVGEQLGLALGLDHRLIGRRARPSRCGPGRPVRSRASTCRSTASHRRRRRRRSDPHRASSSSCQTSCASPNDISTLRSRTRHQRAFRQA